MAEFVMKDLTDQYEIESRATSSWEHGNPIHQGTQKIFQQYQVPYDPAKTSLQIKEEDFYNFDLILGMDENNVADLKCARSVVYRWFWGDLFQSPERL